jgi:hypothetical protein
MKSAQFVEVVPERPVVDGHALPVEEGEALESDLASSIVERARPIGHDETAIRQRLDVVMDERTIREDLGRVPIHFEDALVHAFPEGAAVRENARELALAARRELPLVDDATAVVHEKGAGLIIGEQVVPGRGARPVMDRDPRLARISASRAPAHVGERTQLLQIRPLRAKRQGKTQKDGQGDHPAIRCHMGRAEDKGSRPGKPILEIISGTIEASDD